jgi:adenosine deaminase
MKTLLEIVKTEQLDLPQNESDLRVMVQVQPTDRYTHTNFLSKFQPLRRIFRSRAIIERVTREAIEDAATEGIRYLELHVSPAALAEENGLPIHEVIDWVSESARIAASKNGIRVGLIISINRHESVPLAEQIAQCAVDQMKDEVVGLSLAGDEVAYPAGPFVSIFEDAKKAGLGVTIHAGEWTGAEQVRHAVEIIGSKRIGHGVRAMQDAEVVALARERQVVFEICLTSNVQSGAVASLEDHPLPRMIQAGLRVTLNSDDPSVCDTTLTKEYVLSMKQYDLSLESIKGFILTALQASFLPRRDKAVLEAELVASLIPRSLRIQ